MVLAWPVPRYRAPALSMLRESPDAANAGWLFGTAGVAVRVVDPERETIYMVREPLEAIMLVGGKGTRLRPLTLSAPKPLLPTAGVPFLAHQLARAAASGVEHV